MTRGIKIIKFEKLNKIFQMIKKKNRGGNGHLITCRGIMVKLVVGFIWWKGLWRFVGGVA
jgi:hypothetical protein